MNYLKKPMAALLLFCSMDLQGALSDSRYHGIKDYSRDIVILENILKMRPRDLQAMKDLIRMYLVTEKFDRAGEIAERYLAVEKDREVARMRIVSHEGAGKFNRAATEIESYLKNYPVSRRERGRLLYKQKILRKSSATRSFPEGVSTMGGMENCRLLGLDDRNNKIYLHDKKSKGLKVYDYGKKQFFHIRKKNGPLSGLPLERCVFLSFASDGGEILASIINGYGRGEILHRKLDTDSKKWGSWKKPGVLNGGAWNCYANFTPDSRRIFFSSGRSHVNGFDFYFSTRDGKGAGENPWK